MMLNPDSPTPNLTQLLQFSPADLSSGVRISEWIQSKTVSATFAFDLSQIESDPKDSVTMYLNWVCLNAKVFNNFGILLNSSQINNFIEGKSTEIYIILKQLHDKMRERMQPKPSIKSTRSAPTHTPNNMKIQSVGKSKSVSARTGCGSIAKTNASVSGDSAITPTKPICSILSNKGVSSVSTSQPQQAQILQLNQRNVSFPNLSLAISPTISHERIDVEKVRTSTHSKSITEDREDQTNSNSNDIATSARNCNIGTIKEQQTVGNASARVVPHVDTLSLLSPDLNDVLSAPKTITFNEVTEKIRNPIDAFQQFDDCVVYDGTKLYDEHIDDFLGEKEKLEDKLNDAMTSYQSNNVQYLNNIIEQYRTQKLKVCREMSDQQSQEVFLKKLQKDLDILDDSLKKQFEESKNTLYTQLTTIHHKRLKEFALKLQQRAREKEQDAHDQEFRAKQRDVVDENVTAICLVTASNINNQNINIPARADRNSVDDMNDEDEEDEEDREEAMELNDTLKEVSSLLQKCWEKEQSKQYQHRADKQKEIGTLKEILSVYQNLSKLVQLQSNTLKTTISGFESLCNENRDRNHYQQHNDDEDRVDMDVLQRYPNSVGMSDSSPDKMRSPFIGSDGAQYYAVPQNAQNTQVQLLSSSDVTSKHYHAHSMQQNEEHIALKSGNSGRKKRRKSWSKKSAKNTSKTPAFSFEHINRQTVSSQNRHKKGAKKKTKKTKPKKSD